MTFTDNDSKIFHIIEEFYHIPRAEDALAKTIQNICDLYQIDKAYVGFRNDISKKYVTIFEYHLKTGVERFDIEMDMDKYTSIRSKIEIDDIENRFLHHFQNQHFFYTQNPEQDILPILTEMNESAHQNQQMPSEIFVYYTKVRDMLSYIVFENKEGTPFLTQDQIRIITLLCHVMRKTVEAMELKKYLNNETQIKNAIVNNENMPIWIVEQASQKMVSHNELYNQLTPQLDNTNVCYELAGHNELASNSCIQGTLLEKHIHTNNKYWIKKTIPLVLGNDLKVFLNYAKDTDDYIQQLDLLDLLTSCLSLKGLEKHFDQIIKQNNQTYLLCTIDIDKFKYVNNTFGFKIGDEILKKTAIVLKDFIRQDEMFCRINEDKFAILLSYDINADSNERFHQLKSCLQNMQKQYFPDKRLTFIGGITEVDKNEELNILIDHANIARKSVKGSHKSTFAFYDDKAEQKAKKEIIIEKRMAEAVENNEFVPFLQPKFDLKTKKICGAEALVRWITPTGMIFPDEFIPLFEKNGFIRTLDFIIYEKVMCYIRKCLDEGLPIYPISLNVSRNHIQDTEFVKKVLILIEKYQIPHELLELEVTESVFVADKEILKNFIDTIKEQNLKVSIDDFGTAYSSLHVLKDVNVDILKIDKGFLDNIQCTGTNEITKDEIVIKNIIHMAKELKFQVICEGVETDEQIELLKNIGCELGQGYVFAKPMPLTEFEAQFLR